MTGNNLGRLVVRLLTGVVLLVSGGYLMVYLYRWEWNRALISGVFFLAAEVAWASTAILERLARVELRIEEVQVPAAKAEPEPAVDRESPFAWLNPADGRMGVFVPLLMGAGVIFSAIAFVIEKVSGAVTRAGSFHQAGLGEGLRLPSDDVLAQNTAPDAGDPGERRSRQHSLLPGVVLATGLVAFPVLGLVADATQSRHDPDPDRTTLELDVWVRDTRESATEEAATLAVACQGKVQLDRINVVESGPGRARLVVSGVIGDSARRKFTGCLSDATLDGVRAEVVKVVTAPAAGGKET